MFKPFNSQEYFHSFCLIQNYEDQTQVENCWLGDNTVSLPDLDTTKDEVKNEWYDWVGTLVSNYSSKIFYTLILQFKVINDTYEIS